MPEQWTLLSYSRHNNDYQPAFFRGRSPLRRELQGVGCCSYYTVREIDTPFDKAGIEGARTLEKTITSRARTARGSILLQTPHTIIHYGTIYVTIVTMLPCYHVTIVTISVTSAHTHTHTHIVYDSV